jgi:hypothetical protein
MVMGCGFGEGMLIAPPTPKERFLDLLPPTLQQIARRRQGCHFLGNRKAGRQRRRVSDVR